MPSPEAPPPDPPPHDFVDAEISVAGLKTPADEQALGSALSGLDGIQTLSISGVKVAVEYDPVRITKVRLCEVISHAGFQIVEVESGLASPITDALHGGVLTGSGENPGTEREGVEMGWTSWESNPEPSD